MNAVISFIKKLDIKRALKIYRTTYAIVHFLATKTKSDFDNKNVKKINDYVECVISMAGLNSEERKTVIKKIDKENKFIPKIKAGINNQDGINFSMDWSL